MITYEIPCLLGLEKLVADEVKRDKAVKLITESAIAAGAAAAEPEKKPAKKRTTKKKAEEKTEEQGE